MDKYRVIVLREGNEADETLFELAGSAALVQGIVPGVLDTVLAQSSREGERSIADRVFDAATAAGVAAEQQAAVAAGETAEQATKRKRRTKAEIAADKAAEALGFRDAAHRAEVESQRPTSGGTVGSELAEQVAPHDFAIPHEVVVGSVPGAIVAEPAAAPVAAPYNPFAS